MIWSKRMFTSSCSSRRKGHSMSHRSQRMTGNAVFDAYKADTLRRLEEEQEAFEAFLQRLRDAKDKAEFDQFMDDRAKSARADSDTAEA
jgi:hypothetical protein